MSFKVFKWTNNQFRESGIIFRENYCHIFQLENRQKFLKHNDYLKHFVQTCPIKKVKNKINLIIFKLYFYYFRDIIMYTIIP